MPYMPTDLYAKVAPIFDKATELRERTITTGTVVNGYSTSSTPIPIGGIAKDFDLHAIVTHDAYANASATVYWAITIEVSVDGATAWMPVSTPVRLAGVKDSRLVALNGAQILQQMPNAGFIRVTATATGVPGHVVYGAFLTKGAS